MSCASQDTWQEPTEEWWEHEGHRIHLDTCRNPDAPVKVLLFHGVGTNGRQMMTILGRPLAGRHHPAPHLERLADLVPPE